MYTDKNSVKYDPPAKCDKRKKSVDFFRSFVIRRLNLLVMLSAAVMLAGCGAGSDAGNAALKQEAAVENKEVKQETEAETQNGVIAFTDDLGRELSIERPNRVIAMIGSFADIWYLAGGADTLAATANDAWTSFDLELEGVADIGGVKEPNLETILDAEPDFIIGSVKTTSNLELMETFEQAGIPIAYFEVNGFDDYLRMLKICTELTGKPEFYEEYGVKVEQQIQKVLERRTEEHPTVLTIRATGSSCKVKNSTGTVMGEMLYDLGCVNIADSDETLLENLSMEAIIAADPDYIFVVLQGADSTKAEQTMEKTLLANPAWSRLRAVENGNFHVMEHRLYNLKPNAQWGDAYEKLADILYPQTE